jgi:hypothetical protein
VTLGTARADPWEPRRAPRRGVRLRHAREGVSSRSVTGRRTPLPDRLRDIRWPVTCENALMTGPFAVVGPGRPARVGTVLGEST